MRLVFPVLALMTLTLSLTSGNAFALTETEAEACAKANPRFEVMLGQTKELMDSFLNEKMIEQLGTKFELELKEAKDCDAMLAAIKNLRTFIAAQKKVMDDYLIQ